MNKKLIFSLVVLSLIILWGAGLEKFKIPGRGKEIHRDLAAHSSDRAAGRGALAQAHAQTTGQNETQVTNPPKNVEHDTRGREERARRLHRLQELQACYETHEKWVGQKY